jgi:polysaccharide pyruvyl transferase WcaK-like protein
VLALGGDNFTLDYGRGLLERQLEIGRFTQSHRVPFVIWGASIGPFSADPNLERFAAEGLRAAALITVRESASQRYLASIGVEDNVVRVADPAFCLVPREPDGLDTIKRSLCDQPIGVNLSPLMQRYRRNGTSWADDALNMIRAVDRATDAPLLLVPHATWSLSDDYAFLGDLKSKLSRTRNPIELVPSGLSASELKWIIGRFRMLVAARTHATIAALSQAIPTLSIGYSQKAAGINTDLFGDTRWVISVGDATADSLSTRVVALIQESASVRTLLGSQRQRLAVAARAGADALSRLIDGPH